MTLHVDLAITSTLALGDLLAELTLENGERRRVVLREGRFVGELPARPVRLRLSAAPAPTGEAALRTASEDEEGSGDELGPSVAYEELFENGVPLPPGDGPIRLRLVWGLHCHQGATIAPATTAELHPTAGTRFVAWEHMLCAAQIGVDGDGEKLRLPDGSLAIEPETELPLGDGRLRLSFGAIIALAGDYYAYFDATARQDCAEAWPPAKGLAKLAGDYTLPTLVGEDPRVCADILAAAARDRDGERDKSTEASLLAKDGLFGRYPVRRYLALASQNFCHFATAPGTPPAEDVGALRWYRYYHRRALALATEAAKTADRVVLQQALALDAFGCHFLTDLFATGHMRVPRRVLGEQLGIWRGSLGLSHEMHCEDNKRGLWCTTLGAVSGSGSGSSSGSGPRPVWLAFGDALLFSPVSQLQHVGMVQEAVRRSVHELVAAFALASLPPAERAEALVPVPLPPGAGPSAEDYLPLSPLIATQDTYPGYGVNHYPLIVHLRNPEQILQRVGDANNNRYSDLDEKLPELVSIDFSGSSPQLGPERFPRESADQKSNHS